MIDSDWQLISQESVDPQPGVFELEDLVEDCKEATSCFFGKDTDSSDKKIVVLRETCPLSPSNISICAGPFECRERLLEGYPAMRVYARKLAIERVNAQEMLDVVESGITYFREFTG